MRYKILLFDADNTLLDFDKTEQEALTVTFRELGVPEDEQIRQDYITLNHSLWKQYERGEISRDEILYRRFDILFGKLGIGIDGHDAEKVYRSHLDEGSFTLPGALSLVARLSETHDLYIITNGSLRTQKRRLGESGIADYMKAIFVSEDVGAPKPAIRFFTYVKTHIPDFSEEHALVIGDSLTSDIAGGIGAGIDTCWYNPHGHPAPANLRPTYTIGRLEEILPLV